ncbi:PAS domain-containing protein [Catalinimonas alkaloidigena]|nr:PAS domain-containing protein [Catalinimonas alkaloidigena]
MDFFPAFPHEYAQPAQPHPLLSWDVYAWQSARTHHLFRQEADVLRQWQERHQWQQKLPYSLLLQPGYALVLTDAALHICWVSRSFTTLTGYRSEEVIGQRPSLLQGPATDPTTRRYLRDRLQTGKSARATLLNYRKSGAPYWCRLRIMPLLTAEQQLTHFLAIEIEA